MTNPDERAAPGADDMPTSPDGVPARDGSWRPMWTLALLAGLAAGAIAWGIGEATLVTDSTVVRRRGTTEATVAAVGVRNGVSSFGALGAVLGLGLGLAGGSIGRSIPRAVVAGVVGLLVGGAIGIGTARLLVPVYFENREANDLIHPLLVHGGIWGAVAAVAGLAFGLGLGGWGRAIRTALAAAAAALLATVVYEIAGGLLFPTAMTDRPVSATWETRLMARLLIALPVAIGSVLAARQGDEGRGPSGRRDRESARGSRRLDIDRISPTIAGGGTGRSGVSVGPRRPGAARPGVPPPLRGRPRRAASPRSPGPAWPFQRWGDIGADGHLASWSRDRPRDGPDPPLPDAGTVLLAIAMGLCGGYLDLAVLTFKKYYINELRYFWVGADFLWSVPVVHAALLAVAGAVVAVVDRIRPGGPLTLRGGPAVRDPGDLVGPAPVAASTASARCSWPAAWRGRSARIAVACGRRPRRARWAFGGILGLLVLLAAISSGRRATRTPRLRDRCAGAAAAPATSS